MIIEDIKKLTKENNNFRKVLHTGKYSQIVAMSIPSGKDIGEEVHPNTDQILIFIKGQGEAIISEQIRPVFAHDEVFVPAGTRHNFRNIGQEDLKLFTVYAPPQHPDGTIHQTKEDAQKEEEKEHV